MTITSGVWDYVPDGDYYSCGWSIFVKGGGLNGHDDFVGEACGEDDARLMCAAPRMLALLEEIRDGGLSHDEMWTRARELIAEAKGQADA